MKISLYFCIFLAQCYAENDFDQIYEISDEFGLGRRFDGIGAISGGGATSKLLVNYKEPQRSQILDYLFKPNFGASFHILKVEIGGDDQSTDGTEASHMHEEWDENYNRGYEWWLMKEAKKRNPDIKLWGLSWTWPGWLGDKDGHPYENLSATAIYTVKWILGAKKYHNLTIDYIGIWNERHCNFDYISELRRTLNNYQLQSVQIVACDGWTGDLYRWMQNKTVVDNVYAFGVHYPGTIVPEEAMQTNFTIWSSEDFSTKNDDVGAGCWARILNQNYVTGYMTSTTAWNMIVSYYKGLPCEDQGLMTATEPWSGFYQLKNPIWITAHTTQFTKIGYRYLQHGKGVGKLNFNGTYVAFTSEDRKTLTIVIETFIPDHSDCHELPKYEVQPQKAIFKFGCSFAQLTQMHLWRTKLDFQDPSKSIIFQHEGKVEISGSSLEMNLDSDSVYTLTTINDGLKGDVGIIPSSTQFPLPYFDNFQSYQINEEPYYISPQIGVLEVIREDGGNQFARQTILNRPVIWCGDPDLVGPVAIIGDENWENIEINTKIRIPALNGTRELFLAVRTFSGGCDIGSADGIFFWLMVNGGYTVTTDIAGLNVIEGGLMDPSLTILYDKWYNVTVSVRGTKFLAMVNDQVVTELQVEQARKNGFVALGSERFGFWDFDDLSVINK